MPTKTATPIMNQANIVLRGPLANALSIRLKDTSLGELLITCGEDGYEIAAATNERALLTVRPAESETGESLVAVHAGNEPEDDDVARIAFGFEAIRIDLNSEGQPQRVTYHERDGGPQPARYTIDEVIAMIQDAECLVDIDQMRPGGKPVSHQAYGALVINALCSELKERHGAA